MNAFNLVIFNIAVDVVDGRIDKKDIFKHLKQQLPKDATNRAEMLFFPIMKSNFENQVNLTPWIINLDTNAKGQFKTFCNQLFDRV